MTRPARGRKLRVGPRPRNTKVRHSELHPELSTAELAFRICAAFRAHPHVSNVLTHISRAKWDEVERSIKSIIDPAMTGDDLSPLERNIVDLIVAERGITGRILKPYFHAVLYRLLDPSGRERLIRQIEFLFSDLEWKAVHPAPPLALSESPGEADDVGSEPQ